MDNNYFTEKIAPKNKPAQDNPQPTQAAPAKMIPDDLTEHRANYTGDKKPQTAPAKNIPDDLTEHRANHTEDKKPRPQAAPAKNAQEELTERRQNRAERPPRQERRDSAQKKEKRTVDQNAVAEIIGVRFKDVGKVYYFAPGGVQFEQGDNAIVETARGVECGEIVLTNRTVPESTIVSPLKSIIRKATPADVKQLEERRRQEKEIMQVFGDKIAQHRLDMKPIDVDCTFDGSKILFYFTSDGRVDFRELVKDLASVYRTRIELRQIGVRDEAKMLGGLGICGRPFCCSSFLGEFQPVSIKMAKEQSLSLNPTKISGTCGRLMCCLKYEQNCYEEFLRTTPKVGAYVETADGKGRVCETNLLTGILKVQLDKNPDAPITVNKADVKLLKDGQVRISRDEAKALKGLEDK